MIKKKIYVLFKNGRDAFLHVEAPNELADHAFLAKAMCTNIVKTFNSAVYVDWQDVIFAQVD